MPTPVEDPDPPHGEDRTEGRVTDRDLQTIVNEVWAAGAEAVAINGQRLTSLECHPLGRPGHPS